MTAGSVHVVILNWRSAEMTLQSAGAAMAAMEGVAGTVSLIDNDSGDGSFETMQAHAASHGWLEGGRLRVLQSGRNGGFGAGNNAAIAARMAEPVDYVLVLNSDAFAEPDMIRKMRDYMDANPHVGLLGCSVTGEDGHHHGTHFRFPSIAGELEETARTGPITKLLSGSVITMPKPQQAQAVDWVVGASLMIRFDVLTAIGGFDESYFLYYEETDLCLRAARAGWQTHYLPEARIMHIGSVSTGMKEWSLPPDYWFASREHYYRTNHGRIYALGATAAHLVGLGIRRLRVLMGRPDPDFPRGQARALLRHALTPARPRKIFRPERDRDQA